MDILQIITKAADLFDEATELYNQAKPSLANLTAGGSTDLDMARERLRLSMARAKDAGADLDEAIAQRLGH